MSIKVQDLMSKNVITAQPHHTIGQLKEKMGKRGLNSVPVVSTDGVSVGVVSATDLLAAKKDGAPVTSIMSKKVYPTPAYEDVSVAARMMRNHKIHHLVVSLEKKVVGVISCFDLLKLIEDHRFVMKNAPTSKGKGVGKRAQTDL